MKKLFIAFLIIISLFTANYAQSSVTTVNSGSYTPNNEVAPNSVASLFGTNLSLNTVVASGLPLPTTLDNVTVTVGGSYAGLFFVSQNQINIHVPNAGTGSQSVVVKRNGTTTHTGTIAIKQIVAGFFNQSTATNPVNVGDVYDYIGGTLTNTSKFWYLNSGTPTIKALPTFSASHTYYAILYGTGFSNSNLNVKNFKMRNGATTYIIPITYTGSSFGSPGLDQLNVLLNNVANNGYVVPSGLYECWAEWNNGSAPFYVSTNSFYILVP